MTTDVKRQNWTKAHGKDLVAQWKASGLSQAGFCRANGLSDRRLSYWIKDTTTTPRTDIGFVELRPEPRRVGLRLQLPGGMHIPLESGFDPEVLRAVVGALS